ncbi:MAG: hypothetical protein R2769_01520 [Saprospiraceae bacterium]
MKEEKLDAIISDNRFGCFSKEIPSVFITHQVNLISPLKAFEAPVNLANHQLIKSFDEVWIPDFPGENNLSGRLAYPAKFKRPDTLEHLPECMVDFKRKASMSLL